LARARGGTIVNHDDKLIPLETILRTEELDRRQSRPPDFEKENRALISLTQALSDSPHTILQTLAETILNICDCGSAGISLLTTHDGGKRFYWPAIAGQWQPHIGGGTPRDFGPCGTVLDRNCPLLFTHVERVYTYFEPVTPPVEEALLVPFYVENKAVGTIWAVAHDHNHKFDTEDKRKLLSLGRFASAAYQAVISLDASVRLAAIVECSDDAIIGKNLDGIISSWNRAAERIFGYTAEEAIGQHITLIIPPDRRDEESMILEQLRRGLRVDHFETIRMRKDRTLINISLTISPIKDSSGRVVGASKVARDITERMRIEDNRKKAELAAHILQVQDTDRRRIARELHDGVGNLLAGISMNAAQIAKEKEKLSEPRARCLDENRHLIEQACSEIRTVSYLLHPPLLDDVGLQSALKWYVDGFAVRSKIEVTTEIAADLGRLSEDYELSLFRIAQECLTNVHRHSGSFTALVRLWRTPRSVEMEVSDEGKGIKEEIRSKFTAGSSSGVGLRGMQERVRLLGGELTVQSTGKGTSVLVTLPLTQEVDIPSEKGARPRRTARLA
jgi:PAS domain S-box-containing protein